MKAMADLQFWFHHGGVSVPDLEASLRWYKEVLGFELERRFPIPQIPAEVAIIRNGPLRLELFQVEGAAPADPDRSLPNKDVRTHGNKHVAFAVADLQAFVLELRRRNADIVFVMEADFGSNAFIRDNAGNLLEFLSAVQDEQAWGSL